MKTKYILGLLVVCAVAGGYYLTTKQDTPSDQVQQNSSNNSKTETKVETEVPNALEGELRLSSDKKRGNLMLVMNESGRIIYLNTSRDFSSLIGKQVLVSIEGSMDDFLLIDIKLKE